MTWRKRTQMLKPSRSRRWARCSLLPLPAYHTAPGVCKPLVPRLVCTTMAWRGTRICLVPCRLKSRGVVWASRCCPCRGRSMLRATWQPCGRTVKDDSERCNTPRPSAPPHIHIHHRLDRRAGMCGERGGGGERGHVPGRPSSHAVTVWGPGGARIVRGRYDDSCDTRHSRAARQGLYGFSPLSPSGVKIYDRGTTRTGVHCEGVSSTATHMARSVCCPAVHASLRLVDVSGQAS